MGTPCVFALHCRYVAGENCIYTLVGLILTGQPGSVLQKLQVGKISNEVTWHHCSCGTWGYTHLPIGFLRGDSDFGCSSNTGGITMSEVLLAETKTSGLKICHQGERIETETEVSEQINQIIVCRIFYITKPFKSNTKLRFWSFMSVIIFQKCSVLINLLL